MAKPQQQELRRSGKVAALNPDATAGDLEAQRSLNVDEGGRVPPENQPGHHPPKEQDKPDPKAFIEAMGRPVERQFEFRVDPLFLAPAAVLRRLGGLGVTVDDERFVARYGPWVVETDRDNVVDAEVTGPYTVPKTWGPAHLSLSDRGLTFATSTKEGVCVHFREPVTGIGPVGRITHPALTVTVDDPEGLVEFLSH